MMRLDLFQFDGTPMNPMYLAYQPPLTRPTQTLIPPASGTGPPQATNTGSKQKRSVEQAPLLQPLDSPLVRKLQDANLMDPDFIWWCGLGVTALGSAVYFLF